MDPPALRRFPAAEKLLQEDPRFAKTPGHDRYHRLDPG